jgi:hypothetical protein
MIDPSELRPQSLLELERITRSEFWEIYGEALEEAGLRMPDNGAVKVTITHACGQPPAIRRYWLVDDPPTAGELLDCAELERMMKLEGPNERKAASVAGSDRACDPARPEEPRRFGAKRLWHRSQADADRSAEGRR